MSEPFFVGIDASLTASGFALKNGSLLNIETIKSKPGDYSNDLARLDSIVGEIIGRIPDGVAMVCIEDFFTPLNAAQMGSAIKLVMLGTLIRMAMLHKKFPFFVVSPGQVKKFATGKGNADKSIIVREVYRRWGFEAKDDNQSDACVLVHIAEALVKPPPGLTLQQLDVVDIIRKDRPRYNVPDCPVVAPTA